MSNIPDQAAGTVSVDAVDKTLPSMTEDERAFLEVMGDDDWEILSSSDKADVVGIDIASVGAATCRKRKYNAADQESELNIQVAKKAKNGTGLRSIVLTSEQTFIVDLVKKGESLFFTGSAGTGKSVLLRSLIADLKKKYVDKPESVAVTASTGLAACNIGGTTVHSFSGVGIAEGTDQEILKKVKRNKKAKENWLKARVLIIDEVSLIDARLFNLLSFVAKSLRKNGKDKPFGGIQIIVTGDFFQLPPVIKNGTAQFAFQSTEWDTAVGKNSYCLTKVFRQKDPDFVAMLNEMRFGRLSEMTIKTLKGLDRSIQYEDGLEATQLFATKRGVDEANKCRLDQLNTENHIYSAKDVGDQSKLNNFMAPKSLTLKVGAQVMLIKNGVQGLVNGTTGRVTRFEQTGKKDLEFLPIVEFVYNETQRMEAIIGPEKFTEESPKGEILASRSQLPLILAWAISIHKSQGQTLDRVKVDLLNVFEKGQAYVAVSRATSLSGLEIQNFQASKVAAHSAVVEWFKSLRKAF